MSLDFVYQTPADTPSRMYKVITNHLKTTWGRWVHRLIWYVLFHLLLQNKSSKSSLHTNFNQLLRFEKGGRLFFFIKTLYIKTEDILLVPTNNILTLSSTFFLLISLRLWWRLWGSSRFFTFTKQTIIDL